MARAPRHPRVRLLNGAALPRTPQTISGAAAPVLKGVAAAPAPTSTPA